MKRTLLSLAILAASASAMANGQQPPPASPEYSLGAVAGASSTSASLSAGTGVGTADTDVNVDSGSTTNSRSTGLALGFPPPVSTIVPGARWACMATNSEAGAIGWNFVSKSTSKQTTDAACMLWTMHESAMATCQYGDAATLRNRILAIVTPKEGALPVAAGLRNLTPAECEDSRRVHLRLTPIVHAPTPAQPEPVRAPKPDRQ